MEDLIALLQKTNEDINDENKMLKKELEKLKISNDNSKGETIN